MYTHFQLAKKYIHYYLTAANGKGHGMHSPFVFDFIQKVLNNKNAYIPPHNIEPLRKALRHNKQTITVQDFGAGSRIASSKEKAISHIAATAVKPKKYGQLLYRLVKHYQPENILELGTSLGITTAYMAAGKSSAKLITIEGSDAIAHIAQQNFQQLRLTNIQSLQGNFDTILPSIISQLSSIDLAYIDGNHRYEPTWQYFQQLLPKTHNNSIFIFDDIHWSSDMEKAWKAIQQHPSVRCTIDIFFMGFVFFRKEFKQKQHFTIRF